MKITEIAGKIKAHKKVLIFSHNRPDGDTLGSATALALALEKLNIKSDLICNGDIPEKLGYLSKVSSYIKSANMEDYSAFIAIDCANEHVFPELYAFYQKHNETFNIDHHVSNARYGKYNFVSEASACAEHVYELIKALGVTIDSEIATSLLTGIVTDTGAFAHSNVTPNTLKIASELVACGANLHEIIKLNFKSQPKQRSDLYSRVISKMRYRLDGKVAVLVISRSDIEECGALDSMTEGFIDYTLTVQGVEVGISLLETGKNRYKVSLRSAGKVNVNEIASLYGGGGHILASGAMLNGYLEDIIDKLCYNVEQRI